MQRHRNRHATTKHKQKTKGSSEALKVLHWANRQSRPEVMNFNVFSLFHLSIFETLPVYYQQAPHSALLILILLLSSQVLVMLDIFVFDLSAMEMRKRKSWRFAFSFHVNVRTSPFVDDVMSCSALFDGKEVIRIRSIKKLAHCFAPLSPPPSFFFSQFRDSPGCRRLLEIAILIVFTFRLAQHRKRLGDLGESQVRLADAPTKAVAHRAVVVVRLDHRLHRVRHLIRRLIADLIVHLWRIGVCQILHSQLIIVSHRKLFSL